MIGAPLPNPTDPGDRSKRYRKSLAACQGCRENFYNGNNPYGVSRCWHFKGMRIIRRKRVGLWQAPPWTQKAGWYPSCYQERGSVFIQPEQIR